MIFRCIGKTYATNLPSTSVIIIFHNEAFTALLRTVTSVLNRSPPQLIHEILLVDDYSNHGNKFFCFWLHPFIYLSFIYVSSIHHLLFYLFIHLSIHLSIHQSILRHPIIYSLILIADDLKDDLNKIFEQDTKVKILRHKKREGLIRARMTGAEAATGKVLLFLDSHCEVNEGWLEPLLDRIHINSSIVVCPVIDVISWEKLEYSTIRGPPGVRGGFNWNLQFKWKKIPDYEQKRRGFDETREVHSPTMAGGLFAIDREYFFKIGSYDPGMDIWGGENLELSFRVCSCLCVCLSVCPSVCVCVCVLILGMGDYENMSQ